MSEATHCYIGVLKCGCTVAATVDNPERKKQVAEDVAEFLEAGYVIERVTIAQARKRLGPCRCKEDPKQMALLPI